MQRSSSVDEEPSGWGHPPHRHETGQLVTAVIGSGVLVVGGQEYPFDPTTGVWVPAGTEHSGRFADDLVPLAVEVAQTVPGVRERTIPIAGDLRRALVRWTRDESPRVEREMLRLLTTAVATAPATRDALRVPDGRLTAPVVAHVRRCPAHVPSLVEWSDRLHSSVATIRRAFLAETGRPYSEWVTLFRLELSLERLSAGEPIGAIARASGFSANGYALAFRRWTGLTPTEYRSRALPAPSRGREHR